MSDTIFKGTKGPVASRVSRVWRRGSGWNSKVIYSGEEKAVHGQLPGMLAYCNEITIEEGGGPYCSIEGSWAGFLDGKQGDTDLLEVWELHQNQSEIDLLEHDNIQALDVRIPGAKQAIRGAVKEFKKKDLVGVSLPYRSKIITDKFPIAEDYLLANQFFDRIVGGVDHLRVYQPIVSRTLVVSQVFANYPATPKSPLVYNATDILVDALNIPAVLAKALPADWEWLETPPIVRQTTQDKFSISQTWEGASEFDTVIFVNRVD